MATRIHIGTQAEAVYDDRFMPLFQSLGTVVIERATDVEYHNGEWIATYRATGQVIARGLNRAQVIKDEVAWLEENHVPHRQS